MRRIKRSDNHESGVSETVGFIIIFGIVMTGIGLVTLYGYPMLLQQQAEANVKNMQKTMIVLQTDINSLTFKNVQYQETAIQVAGGTLSVKDVPNPKPYFEIQIPSEPSVIVYPGKLRFISEDGATIIALENGAVITRYPGISGSYMNAEPRWYYDETTNTFVITLIRIVGREDFGQTGIGTVAIELSDTNPPHDNRYSIPAGSSVNILYHNDLPNDDFFRAWEMYFQKPDLQLSESTGNNPPFDLNYEFSPSVDSTLVIKTVNMTVLSL
jgi:hypothetical protein